MIGDDAGEFRFIGCRNDWRLGEFPGEYVECCRLGHKVRHMTFNRERVYFCRACGIKYTLRLDEEVKQ